MILKPAAITALHRCFTKLLIQIFVNLSASYHHHHHPLLDSLPYCYSHYQFQFSFSCHFPISSTTISFLVFPQPYHSHQLYWNSLKVFFYWLFAFSLDVSLSFHAIHLTTARNHYPFCFYFQVNHDAFL